MCIESSIFMQNIIFHALFPNSKGLLTVLIMEIESISILNKNVNDDYILPTF